MKPTTESIVSANASSCNIRDAAAYAATCIYTAGRLYQSDATKAALAELHKARKYLNSLRQSQLAALKNIDDAIRTAEAYAYLQKPLTPEELSAHADHKLPPMPERQP